jgi:hypothetical protein
MLACPLQHLMSYASSIVALSEKVSAFSAEGKDYLQAAAAICGQEPVTILLRAYADSVAAKALAERNPGDRLIVSGEASLQQPDGDVPIITASVVSSAFDDQYLNEVVIVGRIGSDAKDAESGKSTRRSVAVNRFYRSPDPAAQEPIEVTDWFSIRAFGFTKDRLTAADVGALVEINGCFTQMTNAEGRPYSEVKARLVRVHRGSKGGSNPAAGPSAVGYDHESFQGQPDECPINW